MKNSIKICAIALAFVSAFALSSNAQENQNKLSKGNSGSGIKLSIGPDFALPAGDLSDLYDWGIGGSIQADFPIAGDQLFLTANAGYLNFFRNNDLKTLKQADLQLIPVKLGIKYFPVNNFYVQGEAGASFLTNKSDVGASNSATFVYAPQVGYRFELGKGNAIDAGIRFEGNSKFSDNGNSNNFFGLRAAYSF